MVLAQVVYTCASRYQALAIFGKHRGFGVAKTENRLIQIADAGVPGVRPDGATIRLSTIAGAPTAAARR